MALSRARSYISSCEFGVESHIFLRKMLEMFVVLFCGNVCNSHVYVDVTGRWLTNSRNIYKYGQYEFSILLWIYWCHVPYPAILRYDVASKNWTNFNRSSWDIAKPDISKLIKDLKS